MRSPATWPSETTTSDSPEPVGPGGHVEREQGRLGQPVAAGADLAHAARRRQSSSPGCQRWIVTAPSVGSRFAKGSGARPSQKAGSSTSTSASGPSWSTSVTRATVRSSLPSFCASTSRWLPNAVEATRMRLPGTTSPVTVRVQGCCFSQGARQFQSWPVTRTLTIPARSAAPFVTATGTVDVGTTEPLPGRARAGRRECGERRERDPRGARACDRWESHTASGSGGGRPRPARGRAPRCPPALRSGSRGSDRGSTRRPRPRRRASGSHGH